MRPSWRGWLRDRPHVIMFGAAGLIAVVIVILAITSTDPDAESCHASGGVVKSSYKSIITINPADGKPAVGGVTINSCILNGAVTNVW